MRSRIKSAGLAALATMLIATVAGAATQARGGEPQGPPIEPQRIDIRVDVRPEMPTTLIEADLTFRVTRATQSVGVWLRPDLELDAVIDPEGVPLTYERRRTRVRIATATLEEGTITTWSFRYRVTFEQPLVESGQILLTTPWYPHLRQPSDPAEFQRFVPMRMSLTAALPRPWNLVSSGTDTVTERDGQFTYLWRDSVPSQAIPLIIGTFVKEDRLDRVGTVRGFFSPAERYQLDTYINYVRDAATFFTETIGQLNRRSWNLVEVDLPQTMSGLSVAGMTLLDPDMVSSTTPFPYRILAHEVAHQWWNYFVEIPRGHDAWLREGLPTYSSLLFLENELGVPIFQQELGRSKRVALSIAAPEPLEIGYDMSTQEAIYALNYHKAAVVLHMLREVMGLDAFLQMIRTIHEDDSDLTTASFVRLAEEIYAGDLSWFFNAWLRSGDVPSFRVRYGYEQIESGSPRYELRGVIEQRDAAIRYPVRLRVSLDAAPPLETLVWIEPGDAEFSVSLPSPPTGLEFDPYGDLLYREVVLEPMSGISGRR